MSDLPPGFELESASSGAGGLPPGFELEAAQPTTSTLQRVAIDFANQGNAAGQRTTPNTGAYKNLISSEVHENDAGEAMFRDKSGQVVPTDRNKHVILLDPADNKLKVYGRSEDTDEGVLSSAGRLLGTGLASGAPTARASQVAPVVQAAKEAAPGEQVVQAATRLSEISPVTVPKAISSDSTAVQRVGQGIRNIPVVGDAIPRATGVLIDDLGGAVQKVAGEYGSGSGPNVASRIGTNISRAAEAETGAATTAARRSDEALSANWEAANRSELQSLGAADAGSLQRARQAVGDMSPQDMGATLNARLRAGEQAARARKEELYGIAGNSDASINANSVREVRGRVAQSLADDGWRIEPVLTPAASRMMTELDNIASLRLPNRVAGAAVPGGGDIAAVNIQGIESTRKVLNRLSQAANNDADRSASRQIIREFDNWLNEAFDTALFSGSDEALQSFRNARSANAEWRTRFGFNARDDADQVINRIVTGEVTPQETANYIVGAGKVGAKGVSSRLLTRIAEATGNDPEALQAIRGGVWNRLSSATEGVDAKATVKVANDISEFLNGSGRDVANRLFTPQQREIMGVYADTVRRTNAGRATAAEVAANTKPSSMEVGMGPMQELASAVLGKNGKTDEALYSAIDAYAKSGGRGDVHTLASLVRAIPAQDKGDLAGAIIRNLGVSPRTGQFSPDVFATQWKTYTPQAKTILFGNAGPHRQAIDDIMIISERLKQVGQRFGNPSGTAQNANLMGLGAGLLTAPLTTISTAVGGAVAAKLLASPAGASSAAKWTRSYAAVAASPTPARIAAFESATRNLTNTARDMGSNASVADFLRAVQGVSAGRTDENPEPERVLNN